MYYNGTCQLNGVIAILQLAAQRAEAQRWRDLAADRDAVVAERDALRVRKHPAGVWLQPLSPMSRRQSPPQTV